MICPVKKEEYYKGLVFSTKVLLTLLRPSPHFITTKSVNFSNQTSHFFNLCDSDLREPSPTHWKNGNWEKWLRSLFQGPGPTTSRGGTHFWLKGWGCPLILTFDPLWTDCESERFSSRGGVFYPSTTYQDDQRKLLGTRTAWKTRVNVNWHKLSS
jgi:hypothetical protein